MDDLWIWLVVEPTTPLKNMKVNWDDYNQLIWKNKSHVPNHQPDYHRNIAIESAEIVIELEFMSLGVHLE